MNASLALIEGAKPRDEIECALVIQMACLSLAKGRGRPPFWDSTRPLDNPSASTADRQPWPAKPLFLSLKSDLTLTLGNDPVARDALGNVFDAATGGNKDTTIFLPGGRPHQPQAVMRG